MHRLDKLVWTLAIIMALAWTARARDGKSVSPPAAQAGPTQSVATTDHDAPAAVASADVEQEAADHEQDQRDREARQGDLYNAGTEALDEHRWELAIEKFSAFAKENKTHADGALYWIAYAQNKLGRRPEALATLAELRKSYPASRWLNDAQALDLEVRQSSGQSVSPESESSDDLKLIVINSLMNSDPEHALPLLEKVLQGTQPLPVKERALFVLSQNSSPQAREILAQVARGKGNPDLQRKALEDLGLFGGKESRQTLAEIYASSNDPAVKRTILHSFMVGGDRDRVLAAAKGETDPNLRREAINELGVMGAQNELWELYQKEASVEVKQAIVQGMFIGGNYDKLAELARTEKNQELRGTAIRNLGLMGSRTTDLLVSIYQSDKDPNDRRAVIQALFLQGNAKALIDLARKETDHALKRDAVEKLSLMNSKEATDFMMELLNK